jgi:SAM-dependent methyltransferase
MSEALVRQAAAYYARKLKEHGAVHRGADWNSIESQWLRFEQLLKVCGDTSIDIVDYGCGYGALVDFLIEGGAAFRYSGYDAAPEMIDAARARHGSDPRCDFHSDRRNVAPRDFAVASGVLYVKQDADREAWWQYVTTVLDDLAALGRRGFAFNMLTSHNDPDRRRPDLFYASPEEVFEHCVRRYSRRVALLHDYPLFEFTILVRTNPA